MTGVAWLNLRYTPENRVRVVAAGVRAAGFEPRLGLPSKTRAGDILVTWNRISQGQRAARDFERAGLPVIVMENAAWGNEFAGESWYTLALNFHNTAGRFPIGSSDRWDGLGVNLDPWRARGETVILPQRGIGPPGVAMPAGWGHQFAGRMRRHPGRREATPLELDLRECGKVITWGSGAAIKALILGIPVESHMPNWIGEQDNTDAGRLEMFRRLAWAQFTMNEIESGLPFERLLGFHQ